jgi:hypothetical protein
MKPTNFKSIDFKLIGFIKSITVAIRLLATSCYFNELFFVVVSLIKKIIIRKTLHMQSLHSFINDIL